MNFLIWALFFAVLAYYCLLEKRAEFSRATLIKVVLSAFVAIVAIISAIKINDFYSYLIAAGLLFAVPADYFLQFIRADLRKYRFGIFFFGAMHVCLLIAFFTKYAISWHEFSVFVILSVILVIFQKTEKWNLGKVRFQLSVYTLLVILMASKAITIAISEPSLATWSLGIGGMFFFISDLFLGIWDYYNDKFLFLALNRVIYFIGNMLIAFSLVLSIK